MSNSHPVYRKADLFALNSKGFTVAFRIDFSNQLNDTYNKNSILYVENDYESVSNKVMHL